MFMGNIHTICWPMSNFLIKLLRIQIGDQKLKMPVYFRIGAFKPPIGYFYLGAGKRGGQKKILLNVEWIYYFLQMTFLLIPLCHFRSGIQGERPIHLKYVSKQEKAIYQHRTARKECMLHPKAIAEPKLTPISLQTHWQSRPTYFHLL